MSPRRRLPRLLTFAVLMLLGLAHPGTAQVAPTPGVLDGIIANETGAVVAGATVTARLDGIVRATTTTNDRGEFSLKGMAPGTYEVRIEREQFETMVVRMTVAGDGLGTTLDLASSLRKQYSQLKADLEWAASAMPAGDYSATIGNASPDSSFAAVLAAAITRQSALCSAFLGALDSPSEPRRRDALAKPLLLEALTTSLAQCDKAFVGLTDHSASEMVRVGVDHVTKAAVLSEVVAAGSEAVGAITTHLRARNISRPMRASQAAR